MSSEASVLK